MTPIDEAELEAHGIQVSFSVMLNGELRFRLMHADGSGYIRTIASDDGAWQNAHYHDSVMETYIVQEGWMGFVEQIDGDMRPGRKHPGDIVTTRPGISHNVYLPAGAVIHTVKHGPGEPDDWHEDLALDHETKRLTEDDIR
ncbi:MAG: hypothetical protein WD598_08215 [Acidimicrobiia bacterium]